VTSNAKPYVENPQLSVGYIEDLDELPSASNNKLYDPVKGNIPHTDVEQIAERRFGYKKGQLFREDTN